MDKNTLLGILAIALMIMTTMADSIVELIF